MRKYYDEDDEIEARADRREQFKGMPAERLGRLDFVLALVLGVLAFAGLTFFAFPGLSPAAWTSAVEAAGLRPPADVFPGLWRVLAHALYLGGAASGTAALPWAGHVCVALTAGVAYLFLRTLLAFLVRGRLRYAVRRIVVQRVAAALGALFFTCADPVWTAGQAFTPDGLLLLLTLVQMLFFALFLLQGRLRTGLVAMFLAGALMAETPMGLLLLAGCWGAYLLAYRTGTLCENSPLLNPVSGASAKWMLTVAWAFGAGVVIALNCVTFMSMEGLAAAGGTGGDLPLMYLLCWWGRVMGAANVFGWVLGLGVCALPCALAATMLPRAVDEEQFMPYHVGAVFFFAGALTFAQLAMLAPLWFWSWAEAVQIHSPYLHQLFMLCAAATVVFALTVLGCDAACRNHMRLAEQRFADLGGEGGGDAATAVVGTKRGGFIVFLVVAALLTAGVLPGRALTRTRQMLALIEDYAQEVVAECGPVQWIFTDGAFDARLELVSAEKGGSLKALSMMSANSSYDQAVRTRGARDAEDRATLAMGAPMALRSWMRDKPARMAEAAVQLGFELWKREGRELPACSGVLARPSGMDAADCAAGVTRATALADRILDFYAAGGLSKRAGRRLRELFLFAQWRIARLARMRAERADRAGDTAAAMKDVKLSDALDKSNESLTKILTALERAKTTTLKQITPREGLQLALARADFVLARRYGEVILEADPDEPDANFGVGMSYYTQKQWARAEEYLRRCLVKKPREPAVWNNLAMVCLNTARFDEAERHAKKALEFIPESAEVKDTLRAIRAARAAAEKEKNGAKKEPGKPAGQAAK